MSRARKRTNESGFFTIEKLIPLGLTVAGFAGGMALKSFEIADMLATKPYVDEKVKAIRTYTDEISARILQQAVDHSDMNRQQTLIKLEQYQAELKGASVKIDMILDMIRDNSRKITK